MSKLKRIHIAPPFGTHIISSRATSVVGSYTCLTRSHRGLKILQFFYDNLRYPVDRGWRNRIGLRNPGIASIGYLFDDCIYSLVGLEDYDWELMLDKLQQTPVHSEAATASVFIEINLGCPNVHKYGIPEPVLAEFCNLYTVIAKFPAHYDTAIGMAEMCARAGVCYFHASNTLPDPMGLGGISGYPLKLVNLPIVQKLAELYPNIPIIGGGGIYAWQDYLDYKSAGATYFSMGTVWFHPLKARSLLRRMYEDIEGTCDASYGDIESQA